jgi:DHA1 family inner membrane transport protein
MREKNSSSPAGEIGIDRRAFMLALGTFAIGTDAFIIAGILPEIAEDLPTAGAAALSLVALLLLPQGGSAAGAAAANDKKSAAA